MKKGSDITRIVTILQDGSPLDITGAEIIFAVGLHADATPLFERKNAAAGGGADEIEMSDPTNGEFKVHIVPANTSSLNTRELVYQIKLTLATGKVKFPLEDNFLLTGAMV